jgi:putative membrane-bound dehydrogenase-like protein
VELAASEPGVESPVAVAFDELGRMFVVEDRGYPTGPGEGKPPAGAIALLEDTDGDGYYDKRTTFAEGLTFPNGIACWRGGVFVTCAPDIYYLKDTDGDGKADLRKIVLTGFDDTTTTQLRVSHPTLALDGWVYLTSGLTGGIVRSPEHPERPAIKFAKSDSRFNPDTFEFETVAGAGQFGLAFDDFGRKFVCSNRNPLQHIVLDPRYLRRNPYLPFSETVQDVAPFGDAGKVWPISADTTTASFMPELISAPHAGTFTSACGCLIYGGELFGPTFRGNAFICEPAQNLVQRQVISADGPTFKSRPARDGTEFLASRDVWFRPVFAAQGPDDAVYICDMYRKVIDHPQYLPEAVRSSADFDAGKDQGRIYRISPRDSSPSQLAALRKPNLAGSDGNGLCRALNDPNAWVRSTSFRLLLERTPGLGSDIQHTVRSYLSRRNATPQARVAGLHLLERTGALENEEIELALTDPDPGVRETAIQLSERRLTGSQQLFERVAALGTDPDPRVRFQCALSLGVTNSPRQTTVLANIAMTDGANAWARAAVLSSIGTGAASFSKALLALSGEPGDSLSKTLTDLGRIVGVSESPGQCLAFLNQMMTAAFQGPDLTLRCAVLTGLAEGLRNRGQPDPGHSALVNLAQSDSPEARRVREALQELSARAVSAARDASQPAVQRLSAIGLLGQLDYADAAAPLLDLITTREASEIQSAAVRALGQLRDPEVGTLLANRERWRAYSQPVREAALAALMSNPGYIPALLQALEKGDIQAWSIESARRRQLTNQKDAAIRQRATAIFQSQGGSDRRKVYEEYKSVLSLPANAQDGLLVFKRICTQCHTHSGEGAAVGPDLTGVRNQPAEALLLHILVPSYEIVPGYTSYDIETRDGRTLTGLIASETDTSLTVKGGFGVTESILRSNIVSISSSSLSLMPDELEKTMSRQELADLIAFLKRQ